MVRGQQGLALRHVRVLFEVGTTGDLSDRQLLERFWNSSEDSAESAFGALVERHGPMVLRACRSIVRDEQAVEDAFQATFLVLVRRGRSLWVRDSLGPWLYQVAVRVSRSARSAEIRRRRHEREKAERTDVSVFDRVWDDLGPVIHEELARLPEKFRAAVVLCCMEGLSQQQAAGQLGWPLGTLQSRLPRKRARAIARRADCLAQMAWYLQPGWSQPSCQNSQPGPRRRFPLLWQTRRSCTWRCNSWRATRPPPESPPCRLLYSPEEY